MPVQVPAVQRRPASVRALDAVGHHQMGVQQRITLPGGPVVEPDRQQPPSGHVLDTAVAAAGPKVSVQVGDRLADTSVMGGQHRPAGRRIPEAVEDRDALGRAQHHVEGRAPRCCRGGGRGARRCRGGGPRTCRWNPAARCFALQPRAAGAGAVPPAWGLAVAGQVLLVVGGQLAGVVLLPAHRQLGDVGHHPAAPLPPSLAPANAPVVHCSPRKDCGSRVVRNGDGHPLWRVHLQATGVGTGLGGAALGSWYGVGWA